MEPAGPLGATSSSIHVECERDIECAVGRARERGTTVRAVGARGSKNDCCDCDGITLEFDRYDQVVAFDGRTVTVQAGMKVGALNDFLAERGAVVPTCGEWRGATVAGSIATGSHGGSAHHGVHSSSALGVRLIAGDGRAREIARGDPLFDLAAVSLGALGIMSTITLACTDAFHLELRTQVLHFDEFVREHARMDAETEFFAAVWFPAARRVLTFSADRVRAPAATATRMERFTVTTFLLDALSRYFDVNAVSWAPLTRRVVDSADRILCPIPNRSGRMRILRALSHGWRAMEAAVPAARAAEAASVLDSLFNANRHALRNAVGLRTSRADSFALSPCEGHDVLWVDLFFDGADRRVAEALAGTIEALQGRCHWGKHVGLPAGYLRDHYPRLREFEEARRELDPDGIFRSPFLRRIGL